MADNNTPVAEPAAVEAVNETPNEGNDDRNDRDDRGNRGNRDRDRNDREDRGGAGRMQGPTDLMPELEAQGDEVERKEVANGRAYEISYIVVAGNDEAVDTTQERLKAMIEGAEGAVDNARVSEVRRLAYPIDKKAEGVYVVINARFSQTLIAEIDRFFKLEDSVLRHIVLREGR